MSLENIIVKNGFIKLDILDDVLTYNSFDNKIILYLYDEYIYIRFVGKLRQRIKIDRNIDILTNHSLTHKYFRTSKIDSLI